MPYKPIQNRILENSIPVTESGCWLWLDCDKNKGYGRINVSKQKKKAHRISWEAFRGPIPEGMWVLHKCDTPCCVNPDHIYLGSAADNTRDAKLRDRLAKGGRGHGQSHLTAGDVRKIRTEGMSYRECAETFGVSFSTIWRIRKRHDWKHVD